MAEEMNVHKIIIPTKIYPPTHEKAKIIVVLLHQLG